MGDRGSRTPPPPDLSEVGSCVDVYWVREGVQRLFLSYYYNFFWLASLAKLSIKHRVNVWKILITSKSLLPDRHKHTPGFHERAFPCLFYLKLPDFTQFKPNIFWGSTSIPPPKKNIKCVLVERKHRGSSYLWKAIFMKAVSMAELACAE